MYIQRGFFARKRTTFVALVMPKNTWTETLVTSSYCSPSSARAWHFSAYFLIPAGGRDALKRHAPAPVPLLCQEPNKPILRRLREGTRFRVGDEVYRDTFWHLNLHLASHRIAYPGRSSYLSYPDSPHCLPPVLAEYRNEEPVHLSSN